MVLEMNRVKFLLSTLGVLFFITGCGLGLGGSSDSSSTSPSGALQVVAGDYHTCALLPSRKVRCWGDAQYGQLGYGNTNEIGDDEMPYTAGDVDVGEGVIQLTAGQYHTCALLFGGHVRCWGAGNHGRLGYGNTNNIGDNETPASAGDVDVGGAVTQLTAGYEHTCAVVSGKSIRCWGHANFGQLGYGNTTDVGDSSTPSAAGDVPITN